jgi:hypothetical protein
VTIRAVRGFTVAVALAVLLVACGSSGSSSEKAAAPTTTARAPSTSIEITADTEFCKIMTEASSLLEPDPPNAQPAPARTKREFDAIAALLAKAEAASPRALTADITTFAKAIDKYRAALADAGYNLGVIYSTPEGIALANDTSHALSPAVVQHMTGACAIKPNQGEKRVP